MTTTGTAPTPTPVVPGYQGGCETRTTDLETTTSATGPEQCRAFVANHKGDVYSRSGEQTSQDSSPESQIHLGPSRKFEKIRIPLDASRYFSQIYKKDLIVLHFTAGTSCDSAFRTWQADPRRIATAYGVDPDGRIVEFFPPESWAYHLGVKGTHRHDHRSIGIEIANVGPLRPDPANPNQLNWWPRNWGTRYCDRQETDRYVAKSYRGISAFAAMPPIQMEATASLVNHLCDAFGIPKIACSAARSGDFDPYAFANYQGVASHSNFRRDKWDVGPAFNWDCLGF